MSNTVRMKLLTEHIRAGITLPLGTVIDVPIEKAQWFEDTHAATPIKIHVPPQSKARRRSNTEEASSESDSHPIDGSQE